MKNGERSTMTRLKAVLQPLSRVIALFLLALVITLLNPNFLKAANIINVLRQAAPQIIMATGMTCVLLTGGIDLSVGSVMTLASVVTAYFLTQKPGLPWPIAVLAGLGVGACAGLINGLIVAKVKLQPPLATYGMLWIARGLSFAIMGASPFFGFPTGFRYLGRGVWAGLPLPIWIMAFVVVLIFLLLQFTITGREIYAVGANPKAAQASGIKNNRVILVAYVLSGLLAACAGLLLTARMNAVDQNLGEPYLLPAIASPVMGGTSMYGGEGTVGGSVVGALIMVVLLNGMNLLNLSSLWQQFALGIVVVLAVWFDVSMKRRTN
jgi:ribose transport system permease protein